MQVKQLNHEACGELTEAANKHVQENQRELSRSVLTPTVQVRTACVGGCGFNSLHVGWGEGRGGRLDWSRVHAGTVHGESQGALQAARACL